MLLTMQVKYLIQLCEKSRERFFTNPIGWRVDSAPHGTRLQSTFERAKQNEFHLIQRR